jgi:hypothetical protein
MPALMLFLGIGFLTAVLWTDMLFDSSALPYRGKNEPLPEEVLASISNYYRRVTYKPYALFVVMAAMLAVIILQIKQGLVPVWVGWISLLLFLASTGCAGAYIIPMVGRLGSRKDKIEKQSELARALFPAHVFCFILVVSLGVIQLYAAWVGR